MGDASETRVAIEYSVYRRRSGHDAQDIIVNYLHYLHFTIVHITHFSPPVTVRVKIGSFLDREKKRNTSCDSSSHCLAVMFCVTEQSKFFLKPKLTRRLSRVLQSTLKNSDPLSLKDQKFDIKVNRTSKASRMYLYVKRPAICTPFKSCHRWLRLQWTRQHVHRMCDRWKCFLFMDESMFRIESDNKRIFISLVSFWVDANTSMFFHGHVNAHTYRDDVLDAYVHYYFGAICDVSLLL
ncbi:hypothetical protein TNCV_44991 [Trichonephila clavipes]|nr:hypothetical protein TNCV_44991 [Trichonephila clavipes]